MDSLRQEARFEGRLDEARELLPYCLWCVYVLVLFLVLGG